MGFRLAAALIVAAHLAFVAFLLGGGFLAWRRPEVLLLHVPAVAISATLALSGTDCPLTDLEKWLRVRAGAPAYSDGFVSHYLVRPIHPRGITPALDVGLLVFTAAVVATAYLGLLVRRAGHAREDRSAVHGSYGS